LSYNVFANILNEGDDSDRIIWNPFSLEELLLLPGAKDTITKNTINNVVTRINAEMPHDTDFDKYIVCMREQNSKCEYFKPQHPRLTQQGAEVMQVISRCRENYKQGRWDEASVMYSLFSEGEWANAHSIVLSESARLDDSYAALRKRIFAMIEREKRFWTADQKGFVLPAWSCLDDALRAGLLRHDCHRGLVRFEYVDALSKTPRHTDACRVVASSTSHAISSCAMVW
jgi:hypothetical protein